MMKRMLKLGLAVCALALFLDACDNSLLSSPQGATSCTLAADPSATPGETTVALAFSTSLIARCQVEYGTVSKSYDSATIIESSSAFDHSVTLSGLAAATNYYYRVRMTSSSGIEVTSTEFAFSTTADTGIPALTAAPAATPGETTSIIGFTTSVQARAIVEYGVASGAYNSATTIESSVAASHSISLSGLDAATTYYYRIRMISTTNQEAASIEYSFATTADTGIPALTAAPATTVGERTCVMSFTTSVSARASVEYGTTSGSYSCATTLESSASASHSTNLSGLAAATTYYYRVRMISTTNREVASSEHSFTTSSGASISTIAATPSVVSCSIAYTTSLAAYCYIDFGTASGVYSRATAIETSAATSHTAVLTGLYAATPYYYRVSMTTDAGTETVGSEGSFTTSAYTSTPTYVTSVSTLAVASLTISWTSTLSSLSTIEYGTATSSYAFTKAETTAATSHSVTLSDLSPGTVYYYRIISEASDATVPDYTSGEYTATTAAESSPTLAQKLRSVWLIGGVSGGSYNTPVADVDLYDPVSNVYYETVTSLETPVSFMGAVSFQFSETDHRIYVFGGFDGSGTARALIQWYSIENDTWTSDTVTMSSARANFTACRLYDRIFIVGGTSLSATGTWTAPRTVFSYVPAVSGNGQWNSLSTAVPAAVGSERLTYAYGDVIYHAGGRGAATTSVNYHDGYSVTSNAVSTAAELTLPSARTGMAGVLWIPTDASVSPRMITLGGFIGTLTGTSGCFLGYGNTVTSPGMVGTTVSYLNYPFSGPPAWTSATAVPDSFGCAAAAIANNGINDVFLVFGGTKNLRSDTAVGLRTAHRLVLTSNMSEAWDAVTVPDMPIGRGRWGHAAVTIQNE